MRKVPISLLALAVFVAVPICAYAQALKRYDVAQISDGANGFPQFGFPNGIAADSNGNLYVTDKQNHVVRKITPAGTVSTLAGKPGVSGDVDGTGSAALFRYPHGITFSGGALYVTDFQNSVIRKITLDGTVTTVAGAAEQAGSVDGPGLRARFKQPAGISSDSSGNLYVTDSGNYTIRKISPGGDVTTLAGLAGAQGSVDGPTSASRFFGPKGIACGQDGTVYVGDDSSIRTIARSGNVTTLAGIPGVHGDRDGVGTAARFRSVAAIALDLHGTIYIADSVANLIRTVDSHGSVSTIAGGENYDHWRPDDYDLDAWIYGPNGITLAPSGEVFVADSGNRTIRKIDSKRYVSTFAGVHGVIGSVDGVGGTMPLAYVLGVCVDRERNVYFIDGGRCVLQKLGSDGILRTIAGDMGYWGLDDGIGTAARFSVPHPLTIDPQGNMYTIEQIDRIVRKISRSGVVSTVAKDMSFGSRQVLTSDLAGNVYVAGNEQAGSIRKLSPTGIVTPVASPPLDSIRGIAIDPARNLYVSLWTSDRIFKIRPDGTATLLAPLSRPGALAIDDAGFLYAVYADGGEVARISPIGAVERLVTSAGGSLVTNRILTDIAVDYEGNIFLAPNHGDASDEHEWIVRASPQGAGSSAPSFLEQPADANLQPGDQLWLSVRPTGALPLAVQWYRDGIAIPGATSEAYIVESVTTGTAGTYTAVVTNAFGRSTSQPSRVVVSSNPGRLTNLSILTNLTTPADSFTMGFVVGGSGTSGAQALLARAAGPALAALGVGGTLPDPNLQFFAGSNLFATNSAWGGSAALSDAFTQVGAFPYPSPTSNDTAIYHAGVVPGNNSVRVSSASGAAGTVIAELYDSTPSGAYTPATPRLINVSVLKQIGKGFTIGFVVGGSTTRNVLVRAVGPGLAAVGVTSGTVVDPKVTLFSREAQINTNAGWGGAAALTTAMIQVGAFPIPADSKDAALLVSLQPGEYSVQVSSVSSGAGLVIAEVYEAP